jgi:hypothetical protein
MGRMSGSFNSIFISLIPKNDCPRNYSDFLAISLCNCIYKIMEKIITVTIKSLILRVISNEKFGFLRGRLIHEAIISTQEGVHNTKCW